ASGREGAPRPHRVEPELVAFLEGLRGNGELRAIRDGDTLRRRFDDAGFGDLFHDPDEVERKEMARGKLPQLDGTFAGRVPLDTHLSLLANADFERNQRDIDTLIEGQLRGERAGGA